MRNRLFATASAAAFLLGSQSAFAFTADAQRGSADGGVPLRGAMDVENSDHATTPSVRESLLATPAPSTTAVTVQSTPNAVAWSMSARKISTSAFGWDGKANGAGVTVAVVDTGVDLDHPELAGRILKGTCFSGASAICTVAGASVGGDPGIYPKQETHGTHVAGIIAGNTVGIANGASILPVKVCDTYSAHCPGDVNSGIVWASQHGAKVINLSLGGSVLFQSDINAAAKAIANGSLLVVAAGNDGNNHYAGGYIAGAATKAGVRGAMIVVGATGQNNVLAAFSDTPGATCETVGGVKSCMRDYYVVAPGKGIQSSVGGGKIAGMSGTSMATPYVSGVAALINGQWSNLNPYQVADIIFRSATDLGAPGTDNVYGRGAVNVAAAMSPLGGDSVVVVTSGKTTTTSSGTSGALSTSSLGVMSAGLHDSALLKNVVVVDAYGRNFSADLTKLATGYGFSLASAVRDPFHNSRPFALAADTGSSLGVVAVSGFVDQSALPDMPATQGSNFISTSNVALSVAPTDNLSFDFGHNLSLAGYFNTLDVRASRTEDNVFLSASALNSPYLALADGGDFTGMTFAPSDDVRLRFGYASTGDINTRRPDLGPTLQSSYVTATPNTTDSDRRSASSVVAGMSWTANSWAGLGVTASRTNEDNSVLGGYTSGAYAVARNSGTTAVGLSARASLGNGWVTNLAWNEGVTDLKLASDGLMTNVTQLRSRSYGILAKRNLFGDDTLGMALSRPTYIYKGGATLHAATGLDDDKNLVYSTENLSLAAVRPETDVEFGYVTRLMGGSVTWQVNGAYQMDVNGIAGSNAVTAFTRAGLVF